MNELLDLILHTDDALLALVGENVYKAYIVLFLVIMLETGLILFPFLPGDGLLFSAGVICATTEMDVTVLLVLLSFAATFGNLMNYHTGRAMEVQFRKRSGSLIVKYLIRHLPKAEEFYGKHGTRAIIIGRFFPILRTYVPFVAGMIGMDRKIFLKYSALGALIWISLFLLAGFYLGEITWVKNNYGLIFLLLIIITLIPFFTALILRLFKRK